jgi:putative ABC transport system permease protein
MFRNHTKVVIRKIFRNKTFSIINILGLTLGITVCLLISQFVWFEWSFECFNENAERTFRVNLYNTNNGVFDKISKGTVSGLAYDIKQSLDGIESVARLGGKMKGIVSCSEHLTEDQEDNIVYADPSIIEVLALDFVDGDKRTALKDPLSIIISESVARKYFDHTRVVGSILDIGFNSGTIEKKSYKIQGVFRDIPEHSHQHLRFILPPENEQAWNENWAWSNVSTYVRLTQNLNPGDLEGGFSKIVDQNHVDGKGDRYLLEPIKDIRLHALDGSGRAPLVNFFILLGIVILLLAWFNYINLSVARFVERMKEVGVRKLIGASRSQLMFHFLIESFLFNVFAFFAAIILFILSWPVVTSLLQQRIPITLFSELWLLSFMLGAIVISTVCSGFYPALFLSSFKPLQSLKGRVLNFADKATIRKAIIVLQFSVSIILVTAVLAIQRQIDFMLEQDLGISIDQTLIIEEPLLTDATTVEKYETFKNEIGRIAAVNGVTYASTFSGSEIDWHRTDITLGEENASYRYNSRIIAIGTEFLNVFKLPLVSGRNFNPEIENDQKAMLISGEASKMFGFSTPAEALGKLIFIGSRRFEVIGIVKDYHYRSLQNQIQPVLYIQGYPRNPRYAIKISTQNILETIASIEAKWKETYPPNIFKYYFLDAHFDRQYTTERQLGSIVSGLSFLAIFISCSGLFALALYSVNRRTKEISIRKVFGATVKNVVLLLSRDFLKLVVIGGVFALPLSYQGIRLWLERYAYKMPVNAGLFIIPVVAIFLLALTTISFQTIAAAKKNPVDSMKYE